MSIKKDKSLDYAIAEKGKEVKETRKRIVKKQRKDAYNDGKDLGDYERLYLKYGIM